MVRDYNLIVKKNEGPPVHIERIIKDLGIDLNTHSDLPNGVEGIIEQISPANYTISINKTCGFFRRRFLMAHILGHYMGHVSLLRNGIAEGPMRHKSEFYNPDIQKRQEDEANVFAAELLLPRNLLTSDRILGKNLDKISEMFQMPSAAMRIRLQGLQYKINDDGIIERNSNE